MPYRSFLVAAALSSLVAGCMTDKPLSPDFGASVRHNMAIHVIDPAPPHAGAAPQELSGPRAAGAMQRYEKGEQKALEIEKTGNK